jgi:hypothetical protein
MRIQGNNQYKKTTKQLHHIYKLGALGLPCKKKKKVMKRTA